MEGYLLFSTKQDAESLIARLEIIHLPAGMITTRYGNVMVSNNEAYQGKNYAVRIIEMVYDSLTQTEKANLVSALPDEFYLMEDII